MAGTETEQSETGVLHEDPEGSPGENSEDPTEMASVKYGSLNKGPPGVSSFLQKRLQKGQKFFDSGDYNVAKQMKKGVPPPGLSNNPASKRNLPLLLPPVPQDASGQPMPVLTPEDLPHHTHPHEPSKLVSQVNPTN